MPRAGLDAATVIARAAELLDATPDEGLSLAAVATSLGVRAPSLYKHVAGVPGLQLGVTVHAKRGLVAELRTAAMGRSGAEAMTAIARAYRTWALAHPGQYPLAARAPTVDDPDDQEVSAAAITVLYAVVTGFGLEGDEVVDATRFVRASLHGFVSLETSAAFALPADIDRSFERTIDSVVAALKAWRTKA